MPALKRRNVVDLVAWLHEKRSVKTVTKDVHNWARAVYIAQLYEDTQQTESDNERQQQRTNQSKPTKEQKAACLTLEADCRPYSDVYSFLQNAAIALGGHTAIYLWTNVTPEPTFRFGSSNPRVILRLILVIEPVDQAVCGVTKITKVSVLYVLTNRRAFNCKRYECLKCNKLYQRDGQHRCIDSEHFNKNALFRCCACRKTFRTETTLDAHENKCDKERCCDCGKLYSLTDKREVEEHLCDERWCRACKTVVPATHLCCLKPLCVPTMYGEDKANDESNELLNNHRIIVFDVETDSTTGTHEAILICAERSVDGCKKKFEGADCLERFCRWLFDPRHTDYVVVAHNFSGFDSVFLMQYLHQSMLNPAITLRGNKIISLTVPEWKIRCIDFLLFCPMPLSKIPSALSIEGLKKGYFPHSFTKPENYSYNGPMIDASYYQPEQMKSSEKAAFMSWHQQQTNTTFNFWATLVDYCENDVTVLLKSVLKYRALFLELSNGIDPFECCTLPQACFTTFRARHLKPDLFGILPIGGYNAGEANSAMARMWIAYETRLDGTHVQTAWDNREFRVRNFKVDAMTEHRFLEFYGCYYHGCLHCFQRTWYNKTVGRTFGQLYDETLRRHAILEQYKPVTFIFECQWKALKKKPEVQAYLASLNFQEPLVPVIFGGRCEPFRTITTADSQIEILMFDFVSMYPQICRDMAMPKQHPKTFSCNYPEQKEWLGKVGVARVRLFPPDDLLLPLVPMHIKCGASKKLVFTLCFRCAAEQLKPPCRHQQHERYVEGTYITPLVKLAIENGYVLTPSNIFGLWLYEQQTLDLFASYVNTFYAYKVAASGFPDTATTEEQKISYLNLVKERDNVTLSISDVKRNDAKRSLIKLFLNNLWGKTCQAPNPRRTLITDDRIKFIRTVCDPDNDNVQWIPLDDGNKMMVQYQLREHALNPPPFSNPVYGQFVTGYAHIKLWNAMKSVGFENAIYCDTDSLAFRHARGTPTGLEHITGSALGYLESVTSKTITEFVATGSKVYSMALEDENGKKDAVVKIKGMRITAEAEESLNHDMFKSLVSNVRSKIQVSYPLNFVRENNLAAIKNQPLVKTLRSTLNKRYYYGDRSVPWGWKGNVV